MANLNPPRPSSDRPSPAAQEADPARKPAHAPRDRDTERAETQEDDALDNNREGFGVSRRAQDKAAADRGDPSDPGGVRGSPSNPRVDSQ
ncbi:hypothetical protein [Aquabacterium sp. J223]|uniref:hypothetical protein n=1 Tax=Aquabacterium sp. J223 TaxID=2898431 RepID=UPI0021AE2818|nr:hypothetical protein [Aquabacterium sp. J223]UUX95599.1 hypothetical protein LRS07_20750 [Aquabacterium sp. J223]